MKKVLLFLLPVVLAILVFLGVVYFLQKTTVSKGALQVTSQPQSTAYLNGQIVGKTPLCDCDPKDMLPVGDYTIRLVPTSGNAEPYEEKITLSQSVLTVVDRTFGDVGKSNGSVISLSPISDPKDAQIFVSSFPYGADVSLDSNPSGSTPLVIDHVTESDHELTVSKSGYDQKTIRIHGVLGYKLSAIISLATDLSQQPVAITTATPSASVTPTGNPTPTSILQGPQITILDTPTGFLRVRDSASLGGTEIAQVHPGETYPYVGEQDGWMEIKLPNGQKGWVSATYTKKL